MAIVYALCCLMCAALNDFIFKLFARRRRPRGLFAALIGIVWLLASLLLPVDWSHRGTTLLWGGLSGLLSIAANLLLIEAMGMQSAGICSTVFRLNLVPVVFFAWLLLGERISALQWGGIACAIGAIFCFLPVSRVRNSRLARFARLGIFLAICAALLRAGMGIAYKYAFLNGADRNGIVLVNSLFWIVGGFWYSLIRERRQIGVDRAMLGYSVMSGGFVVGIVFFMAASLQYGEAGIVLPIMQMSFPVTMLFGTLFLKEPVSSRQLVGTGLGILAVLLLCCDS